MARERILICDDDSQIRRALRLVLSEAGFEVMQAATAAEALDRAAIAAPDAAVVDLMLPDEHGIEVCRRLREWGRMPILVLSALADEDKKIEALHCGADDYVTKPFGPGELIARIEALLRRAGGGTGEPRVEAAGLVVDLAGHTVWVNNERIHLTPIEFSLLRALVLNRGRLMTHRQLLTDVWGPQYAEATAVLRTHIANLRRKLRENAREHRLIRTDSGIGYRFDG